MQENMFASQNNGGQLGCLMGMELNWWKELKEYWQECVTKNKSAQLVGARGAIANVTTHGHGGKGLVEAKLVIVFQTLSFH